MGVITVAQLPIMSYEMPQSWILLTNEDNQCYLPLQNRKSIVGNPERLHAINFWSEPSEHTVCALFWGNKQALCKNTMLPKGILPKERL